MNFIITFVTIIYSIPENILLYTWEYFIVKKDFQVLSTNLEKIVMFDVSMSEIRYTMYL